MESRFATPDGMRTSVFFDGPESPARYSRFWMLLGPIQGTMLAAVLGDRANLARSLVLVIAGAGAAIGAGSVGAQRTASLRKPVALLVLMLVIIEHRSGELIVSLDGPLPLPDTVSLESALDARGIDVDTVSLVLIPVYEVEFGE